MSAAPPSFLSDAPPAPQAVRFAVFGKHPSAADHLAELGLSTPSLVAFKQGFYTDGISTCLSRQAWSKQIPAGTAVPFDHSLLAVGSGGWIAARFRQSTDTSGRNQFPLVVAVHGGNHELLRAATGLWQWLDEAHGRLAQATDLRAAHGECQSALADQVAAWEKQPPLGRDLRAGWSDDAALGPDRVGLWRVCHALAPTGAGGSRARVPLPAGSQAQGIVLWASWLRYLLPTRPISLVWQAGTQHADNALTAPDAALLAPIFASSEDVPLTSAVPFTIAATLSDQASASLNEWLSSLTLFPASPAPKTEGLTSKLRSWFGH